MLNRKYIIAIIAVFNLGARLWTISERSFWLDEAVSFSLAIEATWSEMLKRTAGDFHPPFSYALIRLWSGFAGTSEVGLRSFSIFWALMTFIGAYLFCRDALADRRENASEKADGFWLGASAVALIGSCSQHIRWSQETRMYTLGTALAFFSTWMLVCAMRSHHPKRWMWWCGFAVLATAFAYTHNFALFSIVGQGLWVFGEIIAGRIGLRFHRVTTTANPEFARCDSLEMLDGKIAFLRSQTRSAIAAFGFVAAAYLPWLNALFSQTTQANVNYWTPAINAWSLPHCLCELVVPTNSLPADNLTSVVVLSILLMILGLLAWGARSADWLLVSMIVTPVGLAALVSATSVPVVIPRYFLFTYMFVLCAIPHLSTRLVFGHTRTGLIVLLVANSLAGHCFFWSSLDTSHRLGVGGAAKYIRERRKPGEIVIVTDLIDYFSARYYLRNSDSPFLFVRRGNRPEPYYLGGSVVAPEWMIDELALQSTNAQRIWILGSSTEFPSVPSVKLWREDPQSTASFPESYLFLGTVIATAYDSVATDHD